MLFAFQCQSLSIFVFILTVLEKRWENTFSLQNHLDISGFCACFFQGCLHLSQGGNKDVRSWAIVILFGWTGCLQSTLPGVKSTSFLITANAAVSMALSTGLPKSLAVSGTPVLSIGNAERTQVFPSLIQLCRGKKKPFCVPFAAFAANPSILVGFIRGF